MMVIPSKTHADGFSFFTHFNQQHCYQKHFIKNTCCAQQESAPVTQDIPVVSHSSCISTGTSPLAKPHQERACGTSAVDIGTDAVTTAVDVAIDAGPSSPPADDAAAESSDGTAFVVEWLETCVRIYL